MTHLVWYPPDNAHILLSDGGLTATPTVYSTPNRIVRATVGKKGGGKWYFECHLHSGYPWNPIVGVGLSTIPFLLNITIGGGNSETAESAIGLYASGQLFTHPAHSANSSPFYLSEGFTDAVIGVAYDLAAHKIWFSVNGVWVGGGVPGGAATPAWAGLDPLVAYYPVADCEGTSNGGPVTAHFSAASFVYTPPPGFLSIENSAFDSGGDAQTYAQVAGRIAECLRVRMKENWL